MPKRPGSNKETSFETRKRCLEAGAALFFARQERDDPFRNFTVKDVVEHACIGRGGFYYHWGTKQAFEDDLIEYLLSEGEIFEEDFRRLRREVETTSKMAPFDAIARTAAVDIDTVDSSPVWAAMELLAIGYTKHIDKYAAIAREGYKGIDESTWTDVYGALMKRSGREPRPPLDGAAIGMVLQALVEGTGIRHLFDPGRLAGSSARGRPGLADSCGAYALAVAGLLAVFTRPAGRGDERTTSEVIAQLLAQNAAS